MPMFLCAQNYIETGYTPSRTFLDKNRNKCGSGDLWQIKGMYSHTFSINLDIGIGAGLTTSFGVPGDADDFCEVGFVRPIWNQYRSYEQH